EGHGRALLMLSDRPQEQETLFKEIVLKKTPVRIVEQIARSIAVDKLRKRDKTPKMLDIEKSLTETLGTRVLIENRPSGGRLTIEFFSEEDLSHIVAALAAEAAKKGVAMPDLPQVAAVAAPEAPETASPETVPAPEPAQPEEDLYSVKNFS